MGMFDHVRVEVPLPDGHEPEGCQTKAFECELAVYTIRADGTLWRRPDSWWTDTDEELTEEQVDFHGLFRFYDYTGKWNKPYDAARDWHEYEAKFTDGRLVGITQIVQEEVA